MKTNKLTNMRICFWSLSRISDLGMVTLKYFSITLLIYNVVTLLKLQVDRTDLHEFASLPLFQEYTWQPVFFRPGKKAGNKMLHLNRNTVKKFKIIWASIHIWSDHKSHRRPYCKLELWIKSQRIPLSCIKSYLPWYYSDQDYLPWCTYSCRILKMH